MCGLAGVYNFNNNRVDETTLSRMVQILEHRGPDDSGIFVDQNLGFAHTRLSIQDLTESAHQPMWDETKSYCLSFNGEIYNF